MDRHKIHRICVELITTVTELAETCEIVDLSAHKQITDKLKEICAEVAAEPKTNGDRIRQMDDDEELLSAIGTGCYRCVYSNGECDSGNGEGCIAGNLEWLKQDAESENNKAN